MRLKKGVSSVHELIESGKFRKELSLLVITSVLILILLTISSAAASSSKLQSFSPEIGLIPTQVFTGSFIEIGGFGVTYNSIESLGSYCDSACAFPVQLFITDPRVPKIHMPLMLVLVLRLVNLSMPVFFNTTLYTFSSYTAR